jgi:hypothetical protein
MKKEIRPTRMKSIKNYFTGIKQKLDRHETLFIVLLLLVVAFLSYGVYLRDLGYYWDDWGVFWLEQNLGVQGVIDGHMIDRPLIGYNHAMLSTLFGRNITYYHLYAFSLRLVGAYVFLWLLRLMWPDQRFFTAMMAVLFLVYPGYLSLPIAYTKQNHLAAILLMLLSFVLMVIALNAKNRKMSFPLWGLSLLTGGAYYFYFEYLLGFELARAVLLGYLIWRESESETKKKIVRFITTWIPYLVVIIAYLYWRVYVFESGRPTVNVESLFGSYFGGGVTLHQYVTLLFNLVIDYLELIVLAWFVPPHYFITSTYLRPLGSALLFGGIAAGLVMVYFWVFSRRHEEEQKADEKGRLSIHWVVLGLVTLVITNFLPVFAGREFRILSIFKSYGLHIAFPVSILLVGLFVIVIRSRYRVFIVAGLVFLAAVSHNLNASQMVENWKTQQEFWWQLSWRVPDLEDGTVLWVRLPNQLGYEQDFEVWGPANLIYSDKSETPRILAEVFYEGTLGRLQSGRESSDSYREVDMVKDYGNSLVMSIPSSRSCLSVYDQNKLELSEYAESLVQVGALYSNLDLVIPDSPGHTPPEEIFGPEPEHRWCFYYQKASLARQLGDWEEIIRLLDEAAENGYRARDSMEWMPFFEAYVNLGMYEEAKEVIKLFKSGYNTTGKLCANLPEDPGYRGDYDYEKVYELLCQ